MKRAQTTEQKAQASARSRAYYLANKERILAATSARYHAAPEKARAYKTALRDADREKFRAYHRARTITHPVPKEKRTEWSRPYRLANAEKISARSRQWRLDNLERHKALMAAWRLANPGRSQAYCVKRRTAKMRATPPWLTVAQFEQMHQIYEAAAAAGHDVDHIIPLQGKTVCGLHVPWNLQPLTKQENRSKSNKFPGITTYVVSTSIYSRMGNKNC